MFIKTCPIFEIEKNSKKKLSDIISIRIMQLILNFTETSLILLDIGLDRKNLAIR